MSDSIDIMINAIDKASPAINSVKSSLGGLKEGAGEGNGILSTFGNILTGGVKAAAAAVAVTVGALGYAFRDSADLARQHLEVENQLGAVLKSTGGAAGITADAANKLAKSLEGTSNFSDEAVLGGENMLLTFTNIGKDVFPRATETILDMSQALGQDLKSSSVQLGKALNDPIAGVSALSRVGVTFTEQQKDQIKVMVEAGNTAGAQTLILNELSKEFGGSAKAMAEPGKQLANMWDDLKEQVGGFVLPLMDDLAKRAMPLVRAATDFMSQALDNFNGYLKDGDSYLESFKWAIYDVLPPSLRDFWESAIDTFSGLLDLFSGRIGVVEYFSGVWDKTWQLGVTFFNNLVTYVTTNLPLWAATLASWADAAWQWLVGVTPKVIAQLQDWYKSISTWAINSYPHWLATLKDWGAALWQWVIDVTPKVLQTLGDWGGKILAWIAGALPEVIKTFLKWETALYQWIDDTLPKAIESLAGFVRGLRDKGSGEGTSTLGAMASSWSDKLWRWIQDDLIPAVGPAFGRFISTLGNLGMDLLRSLGDLAKELGKTLWQWIVDITPIALKKLADWGGELWDWIKTSAPAWRDKLAEWAEAAWTWIRDTAIPKALEQLGKWGAMLWGWVKDNAPTWIKNLGLWAEAAWKWITDTAIPKALEQLGIWFKNIQDWLTNNWTKWQEDLVQRGKDAMKWLQDGIEYGWAKARDWFFSDTAFGGFVGDILQVLDIKTGPAYGVFYDHGKKLVYSLNDGSRFGLPALTQTGADMGDAMSNGLKENMIMHSPSRKMFGYGEDIVGGLGQGVNSAIPTLRTYIDQATSAITGAFTSRTYIDQTYAAGQNMAMSIGNGLRSEAQYIADQIKTTMDLAAAAFRGEVDTFARQAAAAAQAKYQAAVAAAGNASGNLAQLLGINPALLPKSLGGTGTVTGYGPNGELILGGINNGPTNSTLPIANPATVASQNLMDALQRWQNSAVGIQDPLNDWLVNVKNLIPTATQAVQDQLQNWLAEWQSSGNPLNSYLTTAKQLLSQAITSNTNAANGGLAGTGGPYGAPDSSAKSLADALGVIKQTLPTIAQTASLLGGISLNVTDLDPQGTATKNAIGAAISSTFNSIGNLFGSSSVLSTLMAQSTTTQAALTPILKRVSDVLSQASTASGNITDQKSFQDVMNGLLSGVSNALGSGKNNAALLGNQTVQQWLSDMTSQVATTIKDSITSELDATKIKNPVGDFIAGMGDFIQNTLSTAKQVFQHFDFDEVDAFAAGKLQQFMSGPEHQSEQQLKAIYQTMQNSFADILGVSTNALDVTSVANSPRLIDRISQLMKGTNADTNIDLIGQLLQNAVNFRNLANFASPGTPYTNVLPTDPRLTGATSGGNNTNNYNITLQGSNNANADILGLVQMLGSLQGSATP